MLEITDLIEDSFSSVSDCGNYPVLPYEDDEEIEGTAEVDDDQEDNLMIYC